MPRKPVRVYVRTRPTANFASEITIDEEKNAICINKDQKHGHGGRKKHAVNNQQTHWQFRTSKILHNASQDQVYDEVVRELVDQTLQGYNGTLMCYGQTGAGKTYTAVGGQKEYQYRGLVPRVIQHIFEAIQEKPESIVTCRFSALEIYNNTLYDLLEEKNENEPNLSIFDDAKGNVCVRGLRRVIAANEEDALNLLFESVTNRAVGYHALNHESSRSHAIFTIYLEMRSRVESTSEKVTTSKIHLVDLAGSERIKKTGSSGIILREAGYINKSLTFLEQVVMALSSKVRDHIPFRSSKLTQFLRDSLGGNCQTRLIANIWPQSSLLEETVSTLRFATRMMRITTDANINIQLDPMLLIKKYEREIRSLKQELAMHDTLAGRAPQSWGEEFSPEQQASTMDEVRQFCRGDVDEIEIKTLKQISETFCQFRILVNQLEIQPSKQALRGGYSDTLNAFVDDSRPESRQAEELIKKDDNRVGELELERSGISIGIAPDDARPLDPMYAKDKNAENLENLPKIEVPEKVQTPLPHKTEDEAFEDFQREEGLTFYQNYQQQKSQLTIKKREYKGLAVKINEIKREIDRLIDCLEIKKQNRSKDKSEENMVDEEEYALIRDLNTEKAKYQNDFHQRQMLQSEVAFLKGVVQQAKLKMCVEFLSWYKLKYGQSSQSGEQLDDQEQFEILEEERIKAQDPQSLSFFRAAKNQLNRPKNRSTRRKRFI